jgi:hypothetical protein
MITEIWGYHIADGQISSCSRRTGSDTQTANGRWRRRWRRRRRRRKKKKKNYKT